jgi:Mn-dependent DtxR family transcriptional regulator
MIRQGLARKGLLVHADKGAPLTERGRRLIRWARDTGRCPT